MSRWMMVAVIVLCIAGDSAGQLPSGPVARNPTTVASYEKELTGLIGNGSDDMLWQNLTPEARRDLIQKVNQLEQDITVQMPVGPVPPKPPRKPKPGPPPSPTGADFEKSLAALKDTLQKAKESDPAYVLTAPVNAEMQQLVEKLSNAKRD